jgi:phenylalanyl-tRNA synthetase beta subunit
MYKGKEMREGFHSLAFRVIYRAEGGTLKDEEVAEMHQKVTATLRLRFDGLQLR